MKNPSSIEIRAAVLRKTGAPLRITTLEMEGPRDDEVLVRIIASGICHTDTDITDGWNGIDMPAVLGHEGAGVVELAGKKVTGLKRGDHVVMSYQSCGKCRQCRSGHPTGCEHFWEANFGFNRLDGSNALENSGVRGHFFGQSSLATHSLATERNLVKVPRNLPLEILAPLGCGVQTGAGTVMNSLKVKKGQTIAVFGTGAVGLSAVMAARISGAKTIIGVDINKTRLDLAIELGATHVVNNRREDAAKRIKSIIPNGVDYALEITGDPEVCQTAVETLAPGGTIAMIASPDGTRTLPGKRKSIGIIQGDSIPQTFIPKLIRLYRSGRFPFDRLLRFYDFKDINKAVRDAKKGIAIKPVVRMGGK